MDNGETVQSDTHIGDRFCSACSTELKKAADNSLFCPNCGYRPLDSSKFEEGKKDADEKSGINWGFWLKIAGYVLLGLVCIYMISEITSLTNI